MSAEIIPIREGPSLSDIVGQIRALADQIEAGEHGEVEAVFALMPRTGDYPKFWGWGNIDGINDPVVQLELAKLFLLTNLVERK